MEASLQRIIDTVTLACTNLDDKGTSLLKARQAMEDTIKERIAAANKDIKATVSARAVQLAEVKKRDKEIKLLREQLYAAMNPVTVLSVDDGKELHIIPEVTINDAR